ncbi:hypothetical protein QQ056_08655 [Oscillatoria laete-virens NRMC-F 0139]|nr:hypothetical protein [Oscillatoria laete-virens]MDL5053611.1 hypothetical protein [Oscillatoria laete-virens NRMC-F 0139]
MAKELIAASEAGLNVIISTHSRHLVEALIDDAELVWLRGGAAEAVSENYELRALMEIGALNVGERIGNPSTIFLTEDSNKQQFEIFLESNDYDLEDAEVVSYSGCTQIGTAIALINYLRKSNPNAKYAIHRDRDFLDEGALETYRQRFEAMNVKVFIPTGNDLESYFAKDNHISDACGISLETAREILNAAYAAKRNILIEKYVNTELKMPKKQGSK